MQFRHLAKKAKESLFLIVLLLICIGVIVSINLPKGKETKKTLNEKKQITYAPDYLESNGQPFDYKKINNTAPLKIVHNPFFDITFQMPDGFSLIERPKTVQKDGKPEKYFIFAANDWDRNGIYMTAELFEGNEKEYLESKRSNSEDLSLYGYTNVQGMSLSTTRLLKKELHGSTYYSIGRNFNDKYLLIDYVIKHGKYLLKWEVCKVIDEGSFDLNYWVSASSIPLEQILKFTTINKKNGQNANETPSPETNLQPETDIYLAGSILDQEFYNENVHSYSDKTTSFEIPFFSMFFQLQNEDNFIFLDKNAQAKHFGEALDPKRHYIYTIRSEAETIIGLSAKNGEEGARKYLEDIKANLGERTIVDSTNQKTVQLSGSKIVEKELNGTTYYKMDVQTSDTFYISHYVAECRGYVLHWQILGTNKEIHKILEQMLDLTSIPTTKQLAY
ncbi:MAG: hypothetical protein K0R71_130 [Bacillales bacterium]|jgi:hypothetical protein|nr:hypothetical protein [Bacillales bacterium]